MCILYTHSWMYDVWVMYVCAHVAPHTWHVLTLHDMKGWRWLLTVVMQSLPLAFTFTQAIHLHAIYCDHVDAVRQSETLLQRSNHFQTPRPRIFLSCLHQFLGGWGRYTDAVFASIAPVEKFPSIRLVQSLNDRTAARNWTQNVFG